MKLFMTSQSLQRRMEKRNNCRQNKRDLHPRLYVCNAWWIMLSKTISERAGRLSIRQRMRKRNAFICNRDIVVDIISISLLYATKTYSDMWQAPRVPIFRPAVQVGMRYMNERSDSVHEWAKALKALKEIREVDERTSWKLRFEFRIET